MYFSSILNDFCWTFKKIYSKYLLILRHFVQKHFTWIFIDKKGYGFE